MISLPRRYNTRFDVAHSSPTQTQSLIMNIDDIEVRKTVVHAINKSPIIDSELGGLDEPSSQLFSTNVPYCDIDLTPKFDYDLEKALLLNCPESAETIIIEGEPGSSKKSTTTSPLFIVLFVVAAVCVALLAGFACYMAKKESEGEAIFAPVKNVLRDDEKKKLDVEMN